MGSGNDTSQVPQATGQIDAESYIADFEAKKAKSDAESRSVFQQAFKTLATTSSSDGSEAGDAQNAAQSDAILKMILSSGN